MGSKSIEDDLESSYDSANYQDYLRKEDLSNKENTTEKNAISKRKSRVSSQELRKYTLQVKGIWIIAIPKSSVVLRLSVKTSTQEPLMISFRSSHSQNSILYFLELLEKFGIRTRERGEKVIRVEGKRIKRCCPFRGGISKSRLWARVKMM